MSTPVKRKALGRGLGALLPSSAKSKTADSTTGKSKTPTTSGKGSSPYFEIGIEEVYANSSQPRRRFIEQELDELAASITELGIIQPLIVRVRNEGGFTLIAGERRWRAAQRAGLDRVPVVVSDVSEREAFERAIVENVQREDLNAIEEAEAFARLIADYDYSQERVAKRVGKDRSTIANALRLLKLPPKIRLLVEDKSLSMGHARALLSLGSASEIERCARTIVARGLSVRATEALVKDTNRATPSRRPSSKTKETKIKSPSVRDVESRLTQCLGSPVALHEDKRGRGGGRIEIQYANLDDLDRLLAKLLKR